MVKLFVVLGLALLAGGSYAIVDGWPYLVLERGFTEVILGALAAIAGLILLALAVVLAEIRRLRGLVSGAMAAVALSEPGPDARPASSGVTPRPEPLPAKEPEAGHVGIATTLAAGAGTAAMAGALTGLAKTEEQPARTAADEVEEEAGDDVVRADDERAAAEPSQPPSDAAEEVDDWLLPAVPATLDAAPADMTADVTAEERGEPEEAEEPVAPEEAEAIRPAPVGIDAAPHPAAGESAEAEPAAAESEAGTEQAPLEGDGGKQDAAEAAPAPAQEDRLWWPRIDHPARAEATSVSDEFSALREQLVGAVNAPSAPEVAPPQRDRDLLGEAGRWVAPRPWPPVTQPRDPGALGDLEGEAAAEPQTTEVETGPAMAGEEPAAPESEAQDESTQEPAPAEAEVSPAEEAAEPASEAKPDETPAASEEGVIGAYQVGETQFTMYADGSIHARTPDGDYTFASMDELKAYLASEKTKLEPEAGPDRIGSI